ncbi:unnamed protein product [Orchesella dallaii]|uniref:Uncharacterized protein n=1 Tax=Orchesella dallaii TaxID=48710 RepID=A0ABP1RQ32_9HEXA
MEHAGTLRKRRTKTLAKVIGLSTIPYIEAEDTFDKKSAVSSLNSNRALQTPSTSTHTATKIGMSALVQESNRTNKLRVTRNPTFHMENEQDKNEDEVYDNYDVERGPQSEKLGAADRPYFLDKQTITRLRQILLLGLFSGTIPWRWNAKKHRVEKWSPAWEKSWNIFWVIFFIHTSVLTLYQCNFVIKSIPKGPNATYRKFFMGFIALFWHFFATIFNINIFIYQDSIRLYINTLFRFNFEFMKKYVVDLDGYIDGGRSVINLSIPSNIFQVLVSVLSFLAMPYQPWFHFSYIYPKPWYWLIPGAIQDFVVAGQMITSYTLYQWLIVAHTNSMEFWLRESHRNYESGYTIDELRHPKTAVEMYRVLQIVCARFNDCVGPLSILMMKLHIFAVLIPCGFACIRSFNHFFIDEFPVIRKCSKTTDTWYGMICIWESWDVLFVVTYPIGIVNCATAGFCTLSMAATVYDLACGFVNSWGVTKHKNFRRTLMSCPSLKVKVARFYFVTVSTTVTFFNVVTGYIIDCIITFP